MDHVIYLSDGEQYVVMDIYSYLSMIREKPGREAEIWIREYINDLCQEGGIDGI